ncbi:hypothetical protein ACA910_000775 [Epithemia clementina (nom. ined.)]
MPGPTSRARERFLHDKANIDDDDDNESRWSYLFVLPVLLLEFLALALTRAALPSMLVDRYGDSVYVVMGIADCVRGLLAFIACPLFGKLSDVVGRRVCLFITVMGTCAPVCSLALFKWQVSPTDEREQETGSFFPGDGTSSNADPTSLEPNDSSDSSGFWSNLWASDRSSSVESDDTVGFEEVLHPNALPIFIVLLSLSGLFSSTFTLVFAYISDTVRHQEERVSAYGLALATFGLSFTIGPIVGGYLARSHKQDVFLGSFVLAFLDLIYIYAVLPESRPPPVQTSLHESIAKHNISWNPVDTIRLIAVDPFLRKVSKVAFLYYTGLWAVISTFSVYSVKRFKLGPERLGELMSALGLCTMVAEAVLVRIMVPMFGEKRSMKIGLISFAFQCVVLGFAYEPWHLFACAFFSLLANLVYPSLSSLVSGSVEPLAVGEALGAVNGIKALTEGIGPLVFGSLMTLSENTALPGWPYLLAGLLVVAAYQATDALPDPEDDNNEYVHELERKHTRVSSRSNGDRRSQSASKSKGLSGFFSSSTGPVEPGDEDGDMELESLISDIDDEVQEGNEKTEQ